MAATETGSAGITQDDIWHMKSALGLAARGLGQVWPNPAVGCILVGGEGRHVVARGWTGRGGRPHAEAVALDRAGDAAKGATAYVTLEPCSHTGETPPCAQALIAAKISRAVVGTKDPDPRVSGAGIEMLDRAGVCVVSGVCHNEARDLNAGFFMKVTQGRPLVTLKTATSLDGRIATAAGHSKWITGEAARGRAHLMRARHDGLLVGSGTVAADDPDLTCRLNGLADRSPVRIVMDGSLRTSVDAKVISSAREVPTWIVTLEDADTDRIGEFTAKGVEVIRVGPDSNGHPDAGQALEELANRGLTRVMVEGGAGVSTSLLRAGLVDRIAWFRASRVIGGDAKPVTDALGIAEIPGAPAFSRIAIDEIGEDILETYAVQA